MAAALQQTAGERKPAAAGRLLGLPALPRAGRGYTLKRPDKAAVAVWERVAAREQDPTADWRPAGSELERLLADDPTGVAQYVRGLGEWQAGRPEAAAAAFRAATAVEPPVLNPAAYLLYTAPGDEVAAVWADLVKRLGKDADRCRAAVRQRLADGPRAAALDRITATG